jgi:hypothetical protein
MHARRRVLVEKLCLAAMLSKTAANELKAASSSALQGVLGSIASLYYRAEWKAAETYA